MNEQDAFLAQLEYDKRVYQAHLQNQQLRFDPQIPPIGSVIHYTGSTAKKEIKKSMFKIFKDYLSKHNDVILTLVMVYLADRYMFKGAFRQRIEKLLGGMLTKLEDKVN